MEALLHGQSDVLYNYPVGMTRLCLIVALILTLSSSLEQSGQLKRLLAATV